MVWELSFDVCGSYKEVPRETFFCQKPYACRILDGLQATVDARNRNNQRENSCHPVPITADPGRTSSHTGQCLQGLVCKTTGVELISLPDQEFLRTWLGLGNSFVYSVSKYTVKIHKREKMRKIYGLIAMDLIHTWAARLRFLQHHGQDINS